MLILLITLGSNAAYIYIYYCHQSESFADLNEGNEY